MHSIPWPRNLRSLLARSAGASASARHAHSSRRRFVSPCLKVAAGPAPLLSRPQTPFTSPSISASVINRPFSSFPSVVSRQASNMPSDERLIALARPFRVLIVGGSYGGLSAALNLLDLSNGQLARFNYTPDAKPPASRIPVHITIVDERDGFYHLIGSPKALACEPFASKTWIKFEDIAALRAPNVQIIRGSVNDVDPQEKVARVFDVKTNAVREEQYDFVIASSGLRRVFPTVPQSLEKEEFIKEAKAHQTEIQNAREGVVVVGGGAVGVEVAAELKVLEPTQKVTLIHSRDRLLSAEPLPDDFKNRVRTVLKEVGVEVILGKRVLDTTAITTEEKDRRIWQLTLADNTQIQAGHVINAVSRSSPTTSYLPPNALDKEGYVPIQPTLQFQNKIPNASHHFAVGDIASWAAIKRCGGAMHMGYYAANNVHQLMLEECTKTPADFLKLQDAPPPVIGLALGDNAVSYTPDDGTQHGKHLLKSMFGDDMGYSICVNYMRLTEPCKA